MRNCVVSGCRSNNNTHSISFFSIPASYANYPNHERRVRWLEALHLTRIPEKFIKSAKVCSRHFVSGHPMLNPMSVDWVPSLHLTTALGTITNYVREVIRNLPEITEEFDVPEYIILDKFVYDEEKIESALIKYFTNPICDENGYYRNDHDYLGTPFVHGNLENEAVHDEIFQEHNYSTLERPACFYSDLRYFCNICQCNTLNLFSFNKHMMRHTLRNDVTCQLCAKQFFTTTCLNTHMISHFTLCNMCGMEVPTVQLKAHQQKNRQQKERDRVRHQEKVNFCIFCMMTYPNRRVYLRHLVEHGDMVDGPKKFKIVRREIAIRGRTKRRSKNT